MPTGSQARTLAALTALGEIAGADSRAADSAEVVDFAAAVDVAGADVAGR
jgi:hypothetical protein